MTYEQIENGTRRKTEPSSSVSVVVPTRDRNQGLEICLQAISRLKPAPLETIVVDSAPEGEGASRVAMHWGARYISTDRPGASRARNLGAKAARGDIIAFTDDDAAPEPGWLGLILKEFTDSTVALVAGKVVPPSGPSELEGLYQLCGFSGQGNTRLVIGRQTPNWIERITFFPFGIGPNLALRRSVFHQWHGFDERLGPGTPIPGHEEHHAFLQLLDLGYQLVYTPEAVVTHPSRPLSTLELQNRSLHRMQASSAYLTLLLVEEGRHRRDVLVGIIRKLGNWLGTPAGSANEQVSRTHCLIARLHGPVLYLRSRWEHRNT